MRADSRLPPGLLNQPPDESDESPLLCSQIIFRKISDVKREEEEMLKRKNEAPLNLPPEHPVRRLFQRFRQQREARLASERAAQGATDVEKGSVPLESTLTSTLTSSSAVKGTGLDAPRPSGTFSQAPSAAEPPKARGWGRLKDSVGKAESWSSVSVVESMDVFPDRTRSHDQVSLRKTDSCDSGITRSDLRLDNVCGARTPQEQSPVQSTEQRVACPVPEQNLQASFMELRQELRGMIGSLNSHMVALEAQLLQLLQALQSRKSSGSFSEVSQPSSPDSDKESSSS